MRSGGSSLGGEERVSWGKVGLQGGWGVVGQQRRLTFPVIDTLSAGV